jgi:hypothetical protein
MLDMNVFTNDAFSATSMTAAVDKMGYVPSTLQGIPGLYTPVPVSTEDIWIEARSNAPALIKTSPRGAPPAQKSGDNRDARGFKTRRLALGSRITAAELQGVRAFGTSSELKTLQVEIARRQMKIKQDFTLTKENMLLGLVQGKAIDSDGSVLYDWATEFNQSIGAEIAFDLANASPASGALRKVCMQVPRYISRKLQGLGGNGVKVVGLCSDSFWDALISHPEVEKTYLSYAAAAELRNDVAVAWSAFRYGDILWVNYRGTDDQTFGVPTDKVKFFPLNAGIFQFAQAPAERFEFVNTPGQEFYSWIVRDKDRDMWADVEMYSYPLPVCVMPQALTSGRLGT